MLSTTSIRSYFSGRVNRKARRFLVVLKVADDWGKILKSFVRQVSLAKAHY